MHFLAKKISVFLAKKNAKKRKKNLVEEFFCLFIFFYLQHSSKISLGKKKKPKVIKIFNFGHFKMSKMKKNPRLFF